MIPTAIRYKIVRAVDALVLEVGTRAPAQDVTTYPGHRPDGARRGVPAIFTHRDGTPYPNVARHRSEVRKHAAPARHIRPMNERRSQLISNAIVLACVAALLWGVLAVLRPFLSALVWAAIIVVATWPIMLQCAASVRRPSWPGGGGDEFGIVRRGGAARWRCCWARWSRGYRNCAIWAVRLLRGLGPSLRPGSSACPTAAELSSTMAAGRRADPEYWAGVVKPYLGKAALWLSQHVGTIGSVTVDFLLTLILVVVFYLHGEALAKWTLRLAQARRRSARRRERRAGRPGHAGDCRGRGGDRAGRGDSEWLWAVAGWESRRAGVLTSVIFILCVMQIGPMPVLIPAVLWLLFQQHLGWGDRARELGGVDERRRRDPAAVADSARCETALYAGAGGRDRRPAGLRA